MSEPRWAVSERARRGYDRAIDVLERAVPLARAALTIVQACAAVVALSAVAVVVVVVAHDPPGTWQTWLATALLVMVLAIAPLVLWFFAALLREVLALPAQLRALPDVGSRYARELAMLVSEAAGPGGRVRLRSLPGDSVRLARLLLRLRDDLPASGALLALVRVPMLVAVAAAFVVGVLQVLLAPVIVLSILAARTL
ncbi:hypothetical protein [Rhabdothermincola sediminis]|uniref:hypothetical protein n=1 Tax=Rhabdothermincola sediminis TaxID=2751370 RepID=UPI001AA077D2|nr:hypothetical protein [Rhabdothermincola sediminis]